MAKTTKSPGKEKEPDITEVKYEFVMTEEAVKDLDTFIGISLSSRKSGVLDPDKAFMKLIEVVKSHIQRRELKE